ncbi:MAG: tRNA (guanosine(46)-N7)-methyltransferase TrmB [Rhodospirillaceae bacterium]|jgi:tRNA (guanine-N7-)-methyltransferase|nr:tRNA (guanosine(46)-N7)-methyltransferase TrmB [Rhodospirillaceae bacterium]MBT5373534.1 tRNA (guanosine(46)-N7)-methyltransferase TrmB [Rhodospirillaceae bacterium]MBT5660125.1 tRNA (guanosine(46)-N7)-methyltransferase TrmB [Rhodospirillaceae bacterium]MBT5751418.1 tRNA (guanosine(46)-N7)-methyltransferase TrmB [Rhodospirillaceae bacterium]
MSQAMSQGDDTVDNRSGEGLGDKAPQRRLYGRRLGRPLRPTRRDLINTLLPELTVPIVEGVGAEGAGTLDPATLFAAGENSALLESWLEIGFGCGEHLAAQAQAHPEIGFIGCEPFMNGVATLLAHISALGLGNIRFHPDDARLLLEALKESSISRAFILFPDPWPKKRHWKRRIVAPETLDQLARVMVEGAELRLASDHSDYVEWMLDHLTDHPAFELVQDGRARPADWPPTRYEAKAQAAGRECVYLSFRRRSRS